MKPSPDPLNSCELLSKSGSSPDEEDAELLVVGRAPALVLGLRWWQATRAPHGDTPLLLIPLIFLFDTIKTPGAAVPHHCQSIMILHGQVTL